MGGAHQALRGNVATFGLPGRGLPPIAAAPWATRSTPHPTLKATPGQFAFGRGVLLGPKPWAGWAVVRPQKQRLIDKGVASGGKGGIGHDHKVGGKVLYSAPGTMPKVQQPQTGPWGVKQVSTNGTAKVQRGATTDRANTRLLPPPSEWVSHGTHLLGSECTGGPSHGWSGIG